MELLCGLLFAGVVLVVGAVGAATLLPILVGSIIVATALVVFVTDFEYYLIFDTVLLTASILLVPVLALQSWQVGGVWWQSSLAMGVYAAVVAFVVSYLFWRITKGRALGFGDVKYLAFMGLALGPAKLLTAFFVAIMLGAFVGVALLLFGKKQLSSHLPFGTFLSLGLVISWAFGSALILWYLRLILVV
jgi:prepilin signal peptidase PulO-like enzyme (type II secretory pathway)